MAQAVVQVRGLEALHQRLQPGMLFRPVKKEIIEGAARVADKTARRAAKPHPADKGTIGRHMLLDFAQDGLSARLSFPPTRAAFFATIEHGRKPGRRPPYGPIKRWLISHGIIPAGRGASKRVREIQEIIRTQGTRGVGFMQAAEDVANKVIRGAIPRTEAEIKALWERPS